MTISKARLVGGEVKPMCDILLGWMAPLSEMEMAALNALAAMAGRANPIGARSPILLLQWGPPAMGFTFTATMTQLDIQYVRVSALGVPTHAVVNMTLKEEPSILKLTNPTSGGRPGRARHVMIADETLQSVATKTFGTPGAWRAIAEVNGIDDPTSLRPGDVIYLPARDELRPLAEASR
jgi:nucleoid-associated protein YgaU